MILLQKQWGRGGATQCLAGRRLGTYGEERSPAKNITQNLVCENV